MATITSARFDDPAFYLGDPNATFRELRETDPLHWYEEGKFWVVTQIRRRQDDFRAAGEVHVGTHRGS